MQCLEKTKQYIPNPPHETTTHYKILITLIDEKYLEFRYHDEAFRDAVFEDVTLTLSAHDFEKNRGS